MTPLALKTRLLRYLQKNPGWHPKGKLADLAREKTGATGEHTGRRLRELENEGEVEVKHVKNHAHYRAIERESFEEKNRRALLWFDQLPATPDPSELVPAGSPSSLDSFHPARSG